MISASLETGYICVARPASWRRVFILRLCLVHAKLTCLAQISHSSNTICLNKSFTTQQVINNVGVSTLEKCISTMSTRIPLMRITQ